MQNRNFQDSGHLASPTAAREGSLHRALRGESQGPPPIWIMRQAGRYLPEYQELRQGHSFARLCTDPDLAVEVSLQPYRRFGFDAVIVFYDILFLAEAMGAPLEFLESGPRFSSPVRDRAAVDALHAPDVHALDPDAGTGAILETLRRLRRELPPSVALLGFAGAPFTLASYLVEGGFQRAGDRLRRLAYEEPAVVHRLLERLAEATVEYVAAQVEAGAEAVQLFDTWAGQLSREDFEELALPYLRRIFEHLRAVGVPGILYINGSAHLLPSMASAGATVLSLDWRSPLPEARAALGPEVVLQGNLDPSALFASPGAVKAKARAIVESLRGDPAYIFNLGHGILPETPVAAVEALVEAVRGG